jgi:hexosaminidase
MAFVFDVYTELLEVFDSRYIHVGGDECPRTEWLSSSDAQRLARGRGLAGPDQLQRWFTAQLQTWLTERDRIMVGWDEICDDAIVMAWRDARYGVAAAEAGLQVIQAPTSHTYFDYYPGAGDDEPYAIGGLLTTRQVYGFDPLAGVAPAARQQVIGVQGQVWTEYLPSFRRVEYALFPRACALSEVGWSNDDGRSWTEFESRLTGHLSRLDALGVNYRPESGPLPWQRGGSGILRRAPEA